MDELREIDIQLIKVNPFQPRHHFSDQELQELASSISSVGLIHPPVVRPSHDGTSFELVAGERRWRAAKLAGFQRISVVIRQHSQALSAQAALIENLQRVDLNPIEIAKALRSLMEQDNLSQEGLSNRVGKKRSTIANYLRLLTLPENLQNSISQGAISMGHAKAILSLEEESQQNQLHDLILKKELTVRATESSARRLALKRINSPSSPIKQEVHFKALAEQLQQKLGTKVTIEGQDKRGRISIDFYNFDDLDRILDLFGIEM